MTEKRGRTEKNHWVFAAKVASGVGAFTASMLYIAGEVTGTGLMRSSAWPHAVYVVLSVGLGTFFLSRVFPPSRKWLQSKRPSVRFRRLHGSIQYEWARIKRDHELLRPSSHRTPGDRYQDRMELLLWLEKLRIYAPPPEDDQTWANFVVNLAPLSRFGLIKQARQQYGEPDWFEKPHKRDEVRGHGPR